MNSQIQFFNPRNKKWTLLQKMDGKRPKIVAVQDEKFSNVTVQSKTVPKKEQQKEPEKSDSDWGLFF